MPAVISLVINSVNLAGIYLLKVINRNDRTKCELTFKVNSKDTKTTPMSGKYYVNGFVQRKVGEKRLYIELNSESRCIGYADLQATSHTISFVLFWCSSFPIVSWCLLNFLNSLTLGVH